MKINCLLLAFFLTIALACTESIPEVPKSSAKEISSPTIPIPNATSTFDAGSNTYTYTVPASTNIKAIAFNFSLPAGATAIPAPGSVQDFTNPVKYTITAEDGSKSVMTVVMKTATNSNITISDPVIFVAGNNTYYCIDLKSGKTLWKTPVGISSFSSPQIFDNKIAIAGFGKVSLLSLNNGQLIWQSPEIGPNYFPTPKFYKSNLIFGRGSISYFDISNGNVLYNQNNDCNTPLTIESSFLFFGGSNTAEGYSLYCFDLDKKVRVWKTETKSTLITGKPLVIGENILFKNKDGELFFVDKKTGLKKWYFEIPNLKYPGSQNSSPILANNTIITLTGNSTLHAIESSTGQIVWETKLKDYSRVRESTPIYSDDKVYIMTNNILTCLESKSGRILWEASIANRPSESPLLFNGYLYYAQSGKIFEFDLSKKSISREIEYSDYTGSAIGILDKGVMLINNHD